MFLKKLEIYGFKSFPDRIEIQFERGITGIVGPNGSGKSNIGDAVRWVLGEQSAKSLRGGKMEDVIFSGTEKRKPLGYCEVALTFDNEDRGLDIDYTEVTIMRRVYRSGEGEYFINKNACRLKDIVELFRDTGSGREGYSVVGQGKVDEILSAKPEDRRQVFEEAAGVMKYKARKEEATRKLDHTQQNMARIEDIVQELEIQIGPLKEQSETARVYLELRDQLRLADLNAFLLQNERLTERISGYEQSLQDLGNQAEAQGEEEAQVSAQRGVLQEELHALEAQLDALHAKSAQAGTELERTEGEQRLEAEKEEHLRAEMRRVENKRAEDAQLLQNLREQTAGNRSAVEVREKEILRLKGEWQALEEKIGQADRQIGEKEGEIEASKARVIDTLNRLSDIRSRKTHLTALQQNAKNRIAEMEREGESAAQQQHTFANELAQARQQGQALLADKAAYTERIEKNAAQSQALEGQQAQAQNEVRRSEADWQSLRSRIELLNQMKREHEGFQPSVRSILSACAKNEALGQCICGVVAELMHVPARIERAIEMVLGPALQNIVTPDEQAAKKMIEYLKRTQTGRATFLPVSSMVPRTLNPRERQTLSQPGCIGVASELVSFDGRYRNVMEYLLGRTVVVENMEAGIALSKVNRSAFRIVTLDGDLFNAGGSMTGGSFRGKATGILSRARELEEGKGKLDALKSEILQRRERVAQLQQQSEALSHESLELRAGLNALEVDIARENERCSILSQNRQERANQAARFRQEAAQLGETLQDIESELAQIAQMEQNIEGNTSSSQEDMTQTQEQLSALRQDRAALQEQSTALQVQLAAWEKEYHADVRDIDRIGRDIARLESEVARAEEDVARIQRELLDTRGRQEKLKDELTVGREAMDVLQAELGEKQALRTQKQGRAAALEARREQLQSEQAAVLERQHRIDVQKTRAELEMENLQKRIWDEYGLTYGTAQEYRREGMSLAQCNNQAGELRGRIRELGDVNVNAIEDYKQVSQRYEFMNAQLQDLQAAKEDLIGIIEELQKKMAVQFKERFAIINENFKEIFSQLFGGGQAELRLLDEENLLECGIEVVAQPPGKKLQMLSLLSGGEKALTAIAILFAMLRLKPTPFCILDEIEAALDEANVVHFAQFLHEYAHKTQFVVITHRKGTMEAADALYGIAMEEKGVSRMLSVRMEPAGEAAV